MANQMKAADRVNGPQIKTIKEVVLPEVHVYYLDNGVPVYEVSYQNRTGIRSGQTL